MPLQSTLMVTTCVVPFCEFVAMSILHGRTVLIVEDETLLAMLAEDCLLEFEMNVIGNVACVADALSFLSTRQPDVAVVDLNLGGVSALPVIVRLQEVGIPYLVVTGYGEDGGPVRLPDAPVLAKPYVVPRLQAVLEDLLQKHTRAANPST
jgi:DNA-binding response OmpR family regulator